MMLSRFNQLIFASLTHFLLFAGAHAKIFDPNSDNVFSFIKSFKGSIQICANGYPFTRHRVVGSTVYWRCVQFKSIEWVYSSAFWHFQHSLSNKISTDARLVSEQNYQIMPLMVKTSTLPDKLLKWFIRNTITIWLSSVERRAHWRKFKKILDWQLQRVKKCERICYK